MLEKIEASLRGHIVRLSISGIPCAGIGVFAVTSIPKDTLIFSPTQSYLIPWEKIPVEAKQYISNNFNSNKKGAYIDKPINEIYPAYYINHSHTPNVHHDLKNDLFWSIRDIEPGDELTCYYLPEERDWDVSKS